MTALAAPVLRKWPLQNDRSVAQWQVRRPQAALLLLPRHRRSRGSWWGDQFLANRRSTLDPYAAGQDRTQILASGATQKTSWVAAALRLGPGRRCARSDQSISASDTASPSRRRRPRKQAGESRFLASRQSPNRLAPPARRGGGVVRCCWVAGSSTMSSVTFVCCPKSCVDLLFSDGCSCVSNSVRTTGCRCSVVVPMVYQKLCLTMRGRN